MVKVAAIILENSRQEILFLLRDNKPTIPFPNHWDLIGGHVEEGESFEEALRREVQEEIGYNLEEFSFVREYRFGEEDGTPAKIERVYQGRIDKSVEELRLGEGQQLSFFSYEEVQNLSIAGANRDIVLAYIAAK